MEIIVRNRQRRYKVEMSTIQVMVDKLSPAVIENIKKNKPKWIGSLVSVEKSASLSLHIVSGAMIRKLNKQWLGKDKETDVLSFPLLDVSSLKTETKSNIQPQDYELGEIFISYDQAKIQAKQYNHGLEREIAFLFVHGLLHIFGFDHQNPSDEKDMFARQRKILNNVGYSRR